MANGLKFVHTRQLLREALRKLLQQGKKLSDVTVTELCAVAKITRSTFYRHYDIPGDLIQEVWHEIDNNIAVPMAQLVASATPYEQAMTWCGPIYADREKWQLVLLSGFQPPVANVKPDASLYARFAARGYTQREMEMAFQFVYFGLISLVGSWIQSDTPDPPEVFAAQVVKIVTPFTLR